MIKSGIIVGAIAFVYLFVTSIAMGLCTSFDAIILGLLAGALAAIIDKPQIANKAALSGGIAGLIAGIFALIGNIVGTLFKTYVIFTPGTVNSIASQLTGMQPSEFSTAFSSIGTIFTMGCCLVFNLILMVGLGALGGYLWFLYKSKKAAPPPQQVIS